MPYARVLFCKSHKWGTISTHKIPNLYKKPFVQTKKYYYLKNKGEREQVVISFVKDSLEEVQRAVQAKRCRITPIPKLASASDITDEDNRKSVKSTRNKAVSRIDMKAILSDRMTALQEKNALRKQLGLTATSADSPLLGVKVNSLLKEIDGEKDSSGENETDEIEQQMVRIHGDELMETCPSQEANYCDKNNNNARLDNKRTNSSVSDSSIEDALENDEKFERQTEGGTHQEVNPVTRQGNEGETSLNGMNRSNENRTEQNGINKKTSGPRKISDEMLLKPLTHIEQFRRQYFSERKKGIASSEKPPSLDVYDYPSSSDSAETEQTVMIMNERKHQRKKRSTNDAEASESSKSMKRRKKDRFDLDEHDSSDEELRNKLEKVIRAVEKIQKKTAKTLKSVESLRTNWDQLKNTPSADPSNDALDFNRISLPPVAGYRRKNDDGELTIHLGQNIWIPEQRYNCILISAQKSNSIFVREMALALFGEDLKNGTVTGRKAPRTGIKSKALDTTKLTAIREIFTYFLRTERFMEDHEITKEMQKFKLYLRLKINDIKKPPEAQKSAEESTISSSSKKIGNTNSKGNQGNLSWTKNKLKKRSAILIPSKCRPDQQSSCQEDNDAIPDGDSGSLKKDERRYSI